MRRIYHSMISVQATVGKGELNGTSANSIWNEWVHAPAISTISLRPLIISEIIIIWCAAQLSVRDHLPYDTFTGPTGDFKLLLFRDLDLEI